MLVFQAKLLPVVTWLLGGIVIIRNSYAATSDGDQHVTWHAGKRMVAAGEVTPEVPAAPPDGPGELGLPFTISKGSLNEAERKQFDDGYAKHGFNKYASDKISLHRTLPDVRDDGCEEQLYPIDNLPDTSVIIIFRNEAWSTLLRTVHSVLDRSPPNLLKEIILVDDFSDSEHLKQPLEDYITQLPKVKIVRVPAYGGSLKSRNLGADHAKGTVLTYLDSHCECAKGWLEPLLFQVYKNWTAVVSPVIDVIRQENFKYDVFKGKRLFIGGFDWDLRFTWQSIPERIEKRRKSLLDPVQSPTMAGGVFCINRAFFNMLGKFDNGMDIWGGENLELSFKVWMCGGTFEIIPCSHVGYVFRTTSPASKYREAFYKRNKIRTAEVWMDSYKNYYYDRISNQLSNYGDVSGRRAIRQKLQCKSFDWYLKNVYPEQSIPEEVLASGEVRNMRKAMCLYSEVNGAVKVMPCSDSTGQYWTLTKEGEIRRDDSCFHYSGVKFVSAPCHHKKGNQHFDYLPSNLIRKVNHDECIELSHDDQNVSMQQCDPENLRQQWMWRRHSPNAPPLHLRVEQPPNALRVLKHEL